MLEQERQRIEQLTAGWDDPTASWGAEESEDAAAGSESAAAEGEERQLGMAGNASGPTYKCIALYSYTVSAAWLALHYCSGQLSGFGFDQFSAYPMFWHLNGTLFAS